MVQECRNGDLPELGGMPLAMKVDEPLGPVDLCFFRAAAVMQSSYRPAQPIQETGLF